MDNRLKGFLNGDGQLTSFPAKRKAKLHALLYLSTKFQPGVIYTEKEVGALLNGWHTFEDPATLRRELYDYGFLARDPNGSSYRLEDTQPTVEELEAKYC